MHQEQPPGRRKGWLIAAAVLGFLVAGGVAVAFGGVWYIEKTALEKIDRLAKRAGLDIAVNTIVIEPGSNVEVRGVTVHDPEDGALMASVDRVVTNLTFDDLRDGKRRPTKVLLMGLRADFTQPERFVAALKRFRGKPRPPAEQRKTAAALELDLADAVVTVIDPLSHEPIEITALSARLLTGATDGRLRLAGQAIAMGSRVTVDAWLDPAGKRHEGGVSFEPRLVLREVMTAVVKIGGIYVRYPQSARVRDVTVIVEEAGAGLQASHVTLTADKPGPDFATGPMTATLHKVVAGAAGNRVEAATIQADVGPGPIDRLARRLTRVALEQLVLDAPQLYLAMQARRVAVDMDGVIPTAPLTLVKEVQITETDISWVLPPKEKALSIPYYREIQAFLLGRDVPVRGGGPAVEPPPGTAAPEPEPVARIASILDTVRPNVRVDDGTLALLIGDDPEPAIVVQNLHAALLPGESGGAATAKARGQLQETATGEHGSFAVELITRDDGGLERAKVKLSGRKLAHHLARLSSSIRLSERSSLSVDLDVTPHPATRGLSATGTVSLKDMGFLAPRIHGTAVDGLAITADLTADLDPEKDKLTLDMPRILVDGKATLRMAATIERLDGRLPKLDVRLKLPRQDCHKVLSAIPQDMVPRLRGLQLDGMVEAHLNFSVDLLDPRTYTHDVDVDLRKCRGVAYGEADVSRLKRRFVHEVVEKGEPSGVTVGPGTSHYRALNRIPRHIRMGALWTEDQRFYKHSGFVPGLIKRAIIMNLEGGRYRYGGSSITQQLVKNLFLSREKTLSRKLEEAILVWQVERTLTKNRILELYLNCIEYGPQIYGISNAAQAYFGKAVGDLNPLEGAFLMGLKPYPWAGWQQYQRGYVKPWWHKRLRKILQGLHKRGWITEQELAESSSWDPVFKTSTHSYHKPAAPRAQPDGDDGAPPPTPNAAPVWLE